jgi:hypothetical protein
VKNVFRSIARRALEHRVARLFGMEAGLARELLAEARRRDDGRLAVRCAAFLIATTRLSPRLLPQGVRESAIRTFVWWLFEWHQHDPRLPLAYAGHPRSLRDRSCPELLPE